MIPHVTVPPREPRGLPITITSSARTSLSELPRTAVVSVSLGSILMTAISVAESVPISFASYLLPFVRVTLMVFAPATT